MELCKTLQMNTPPPPPPFFPVAGDGRNDSPGHSAQYLTYTFIEHETKDILHVAFMDKREANMKSANMEALAFKCGLRTKEEQGLSIAEVVTDAHSSIAKHEHVL